MYNIFSFVLETVYFEIKEDIRVAIELTRYYTSFTAESYFLRLKKNELISCMDYSDNYEKWK